MTPGSVLLGSAGQYFECGHQHGAGDRCLSFQYVPEYFETLTADAGVRGATRHATGAAAASGIAIRQAARLDSDRGIASDSVSPAAEARVVRTVRMMERHPDAPQTLVNLAREARLSPFHFLRTFEQVTGVTPHQYIRRARLRDAATRLLMDRSKILDIAFDSGFGDVSNFNRAFRAEFGISPRAYRRENRSYS